MPRVITLTTDFGTRDDFVGVMKGVILRINPDVHLVDVTHAIEPHNLAHAAFVLAHAAPYFPANTIHLVVVDPGVGSARRALAAQIGATIFVAPDNGVLSSVLQPASARVIHLTNPAYFLPRVSTTFHGRDIFAPVAAHLSLGVSLAALGEPIDDWVRLPIERATRRGDEIVGCIVYVDHFGNASTNIGEELLAGLARAQLRVHVGAHTLRGIHTTYADAAPGDALALVSSAWTVEIAVREGNAARTLGLRVGDGVRIGRD